MPSKSRDTAVAQSDPNTGPRRLLDIIQAPGGQTDNENLLRTLSAISTLVSSLVDAPSWLTDQLRGVAHGRKREEAVFAQQDRGRTNPLHGLITDHPIYAALWYQPPDHNAESIVRQFQAVLLVAVAQYPDTAARNYLATLREAGLCVRRVCERSELRKLASRAIASPIRSLQEAERSITDYLANIPQTQTEAIRLLRGYARLISYARRASKPPVRSTQSPSGRHVASISEIELDAPFKAAGEFTDDQINTAGINLRVSVGVAPVRETPSRRHVAIALGQAGAASAQARIIQAKTQARAMATTAQRLPFASDRLQLYDVGCLIGWLGRNESNKKEGSAVPLLLTMLLLGADIRRITQIEVSHNLEDGNSEAPRLILAPLSWSIPTPKLKNPCIPKPSVQDFHRTPSRCLTIPLPKNFPGMAELIAVSTQLVGGHLFAATERHLELECARIFKTINQETGSRLTLKRVTEFVERMVAGATQDQADGAFFSSHDDVSGSAARLYYYCPNAKNLVDVYRQIWQSVLRDTALDWSWTSPSPVGRTTYVGSAACPTDQATAQMVAKLKGRIKTLARGRRGVTRGIRFHNELTTYTTVFGMWSAGLRAIQDPIEVELIDPAAGFLGVSEKDSDDYSASRVIPLVPIALAQMASYARHRKSFIEDMKSHGLAISPHNWLFYMEGKWACPVTPSRLHEHLGDDYPFRLNAQRHYLRTRLREYGVAGTFVDAFMGHGGAGEEPYGRYSAISPVMLRRAVGEPLQKLLTNMGWEVIESSH